MSAVEFSESDLDAAQLRVRRSLSAPAFLLDKVADTTATEVAERWSMSVKELLGPKRTMVHALARADLYRRLRAFGWSYPRIGSFVRRDHSTVMDALKRHP